LEEGGDCAHREWLAGEEQGTVQIGEGESERTLMAKSLPCDPELGFGRKD